MVTTPLNGATAPPQYVDAVIPEPFEFGLFSVARMLDIVDEHEENGVEFQPYLTEAALGYARGCADVDPKTTTRNQPAGNFGSPYTLYQRFACGVFGYTLEQGRDIARQNLMLGAEKGAEHELWTGDLGSIASFRGAIDLTPVAGPVSVVSGVAALEDWLGSNYNGIGILHCQRGLTTVMQSANLLRQEAGKLLTFLDTRIAAGGGYDGSGPDGSTPAAGSTWIYATGDVIIRRGAIFDTPENIEASIHLSTNDVVAIAEQTYVNSIDGDVGPDTDTPLNVAAIRVLLDGCCG